MANVLKSGKLPAPARIIQDTVVGPSLGQESINAGMMSFILAFILVLIYMIFYYNTAGLCCRYCIDMQPVLLAGRIGVVRSRTDTAGYCRYRIDDGYGRRCERDHL